MRKARQPGAHHRAADRRGQPARISGPTASTARSKTSSSFRTRSHPASPASSSRHCRPPKCAAPPRRPTTDLTAYDLYLRALAIVLSDNERADRRGSGIARAGDRDRSGITGRHCPWRRSATSGSSLTTGSKRRRQPPPQGRRSRSAGASGGGERPGRSSRNAALVLAHFGEDIGAMIGLVDRALALNPSFARGWYVSGTLRLWAGQH